MNIQSNCTELGTPTRAKMSDQEEKQLLLVDQLDIYEMILSGNKLSPEIIAYYEYCTYRQAGGYRQ
jgi:hypothetical protein